MREGTWEKVISGQTTGGASVLQPHQAACEKDLLQPNGWQQGERKFSSTAFKAVIKGTIVWALLYGVLTIISMATGFSPVTAYSSEQISPEGVHEVLGMIEETQRVQRIASQGWCKGAPFQRGRVTE